uniref:Putative secreted protein n=1 Tax=Anopheles darlingi TaxID=43151 RepID=A0A2M4DDE4_ANODA
MISVGPVVGLWCVVSSSSRSASSEVISTTGVPPVVVLLATPAFPRCSSASISSSVTTADDVSSAGFEASDARSGMASVVTYFTG